MCAPHMPCAGDTPLDPQFLDFFLKGNLSLEKSHRQKPYEWFPDQGWQDLMRLVQLGQTKLNAEGKMHPLARWAPVRSLGGVPAPAGSGGAVLRRTCGVTASMGAHAQAKLTSPPSLTLPQAGRRH